MYVRFNNTAFVSNYKRNDLLSTQMTLYAIKVGQFSKEDFDFFESINKMDKMFNGINSNKTLYDVDNPGNKISDNQSIEKQDSQKDIELYDVVYACIVDEKGE